MSTATTQEPLNYDPTDPERMRLPAGITCGNCRHIGRCKSIYGHVESDTYCDWSPSRFQPRQAQAEQVAAPVPPLPEPLAHTRSQLLVVTTLLEKSLNVVRNVEAKGSSEDELLQDLIHKGDAAIAAVLLEVQCRG